MTPGARLQSVIDFLGDFERSRLPVDRALRDFFRARRYAGSKDRAAVAERVFAILRRRAHLIWRMGTDTPRALVLGALADEGLTQAEIEAQCVGGYAPAPLNADERAVLSTQRPAPPAWVEGEYPEFLATELSRALGPDLPAAMAAMAGRAGIDIRVNTLRATRAALQATLTAEGFAAEVTAFSPWGLRLAAGPAAGKLSATAAFAAGQFEFQDEAAQIVALLCGVSPGINVLDLAAGTGGKTLALAAAMENRGTILAHDIAANRLKQLEGRAARAGIDIVRTATALPDACFDVVLLDAPCSGTGTWRRQPELRWRLTAERLTELTATQDALLDQAAAATAPGGRLVYATCSLLACENEDRVAAFLARHPGFSPVDATEVWPTQPVPPGLGHVLRAAPHTTGTDGFFAAVLQAS